MCSVCQIESKMVHWIESKTTSQSEIANMGQIGIGESNVCSHSLIKSES